MDGIFIRKFTSLYGPLGGPILELEEGMRVLLAIFILSFLAPSVHADAPPAAEGEATFSSWATEPGFNKRTDEESKAARFLREVFQSSTPKTQQNAADSQTPGSGSH